MEFLRKVIRYCVTLKEHFNSFTVHSLLHWLNIFAIKNSLDIYYTDSCRH